MSDFKATERLMGGSIVVGLASLLNWAASQSGDSGSVGTVLILAMVVGAFWGVSGLFELVVGQKLREEDPGVGRSPAEPV